MILHASATAAGTPLDHYWERVVGAGRAAEALRSDWQAHLARVHAECGFASVRFHGLFHDDMFVHRTDGPPTFGYVDAVVDRMLELGVRPFVELGFAPGALAREKATVFWWGAHGSPPVDLDAWADLVHATVEHWVHRYGRAEVRSWWFEVWNEPNLDPFFRGTRSEYYALYAATVAAVKAVDPQLRVGGPATSNFVPDARFDGEREDVTQHVGEVDLDALEWRPVWLEHFLEHCAREGLPVDFVSVHPYPSDWALDEHGGGLRRTRGVDATPNDLALLRKIVDGSAFPDAAIHITEWNSSSSPRDHAHDTLPAATYVVRTVLASLGLVDSLAYWTFTDIFEENGAGETEFHGGFGMISGRGIAKPVLHAYRFLHALGDELLARTACGVVSRHADTGLLTVLAFHHPPEVTRSTPASYDDPAQALATAATGSPATLRIELDGVTSGAPFVLEVLDADHGDARTAWTRLGEPQDWTPARTAAVARAGEATAREHLTADADGRLMVERELAPWSLVLLRQL